MSAVRDAFASLFKPKPRMLSAVPSEPQDVLEARDKLRGAQDTAARVCELATVAENEAKKWTEAHEHARRRVAAAEEAERTNASVIELHEADKALREAGVEARKTEARAKRARASADHSRNELERFERDLARVLAEHACDLPRLEEDLAMAAAQLKAPATWATRSPVGLITSAITEYNAKAKTARDAGADSYEYRPVDALVAVRAVLVAFGVEIGRAEDLRGLREAIEAQRDIALLERVTALKDKPPPGSQWAADAREALQTARTYREVDAAVAMADKARAAQAEVQRKARYEADKAAAWCDGRYDRMERQHGRKVVFPPDALQAAARLIEERNSRGENGPQSPWALLMWHSNFGVPLPSLPAPARTVIVEGEVGHRT